MLPNHVKGSSEGENSLPFCLIFPSRGWPSSPELNRATHLLDDVGGGMVGEIRKEVYKKTQERRSDSAAARKGGPDTTASESSGEGRYRRNLHIREK